MGHVRPLGQPLSDETRHRAGFFAPAENRQRLCLRGSHAFMQLKCINKCICALTVYASMHILRLKPLDKAARNEALQFHHNRQR
ncbi:hypothetical protein EMIT0P12_70045 [Pseudomonas sp. IT-P12]